MNPVQVRSPRIFKSHLRREEIAKGGKYVYVVRNPEDVFVSYYHFTGGMRGLRENDITMHQFEESLFGAHRGPVWDHYMGWHAVKDDPNVLWVFFEDLKEDFRGQVDRVADFMEIPEGVREERVAEALHKGTYTYEVTKFSGFLNPLPNPFSHTELGNLSSLCLLYGYPLPSTLDVICV